MWYFIYAVTINEAKDSSAIENIVTTHHPFYDGNGRTGRILNILYLVLNNLIDSPILYLSKYINKTKQEYYKLFNEARNTNNFEDWILYILKGIEITKKNLETNYLKYIQKNY